MFNYLSANENTIRMVALDRNGFFFLFVITMLACCTSFLRLIVINIHYSELTRDQIELISTIIFFIVNFFKHRLNEEVIVFISSFFYQCSLLTFRTIVRFNYSVSIWNKHMNIILESFLNWFITKCGAS